LGADGRFGREVRFGEIPLPIARTVSGEVTRGCARSAIVVVNGHGVFLGTDLASPENGQWPLRKRGHYQRMCVARSKGLEPLTF
jgi:hypothetical protein